RDGRRSALGIQTPKPRALLDGRKVPLGVLTPGSFDPLVGERQQVRRHTERECLRGFEIDHQLELGWLHHRKVGGLCTGDNPAGVHANLAVCVAEVRTVADEAAGLDKFPTIVNRGNFVMGREHDDLLKATDEEWIGADDERATALPKHGESVVYIALATSIEDTDRQSALTRRS